MSTIANIIWIIFGGLVTAIAWCFAGLVFCITIIGIPLGRQCFKMASLTLAPFGKTIVYGGGAPSLIANIFWLILAGRTGPFRAPGQGFEAGMRVLGYDRAPVGPGGIGILVRP